MSNTNPDLYTGITTRERLEHVPYGHEVEWIAWDSDFRNSDLRHGDIIVAVDDKRYLKETRDKEFSMAVGNYAEPAYWRQVGAKPDNKCTWKSGVKENSCQLPESYSPNNVTTLRKIAPQWVPVAPSDLSTMVFLLPGRDGMRNL